MSDQPQWKLIDENGEEITITDVVVTSSWSGWSPDGVHWYEGPPPTQAAAPPPEVGTDG